MISLLFAYIVIFLLLIQFRCFILQPFKRKLDKRHKVNHCFPALLIKLLKRTFAIKRFYELSYEFQGFFFKFSDLFLVHIFDFCLPIKKLSHFLLIRNCLFLILSQTIIIIIKLVNFPMNFYFVIRLIKAKSKFAHLFFTPLSKKEPSKDGSYPSTPPFPFGGVYSGSPLKWISKEISPFSPAFPPGPSMLVIVQSPVSFEPSGCSHSKFVRLAVPTPNALSKIKSCAGSP